MAQRTFTVAMQVQDPLSAERMVEVLREAGIDGFSRAGGAASSDAFAAASPGFWDILAPTEHLDQATKLLMDELADIEKEGEANAKAAEDEAMSGENPVG